mgnify:CR=1
MSKTQIKRKINNLLDGMPEDAEIIEIAYINPLTGERTVLECYPDRSTGSNLTTKANNSKSKHNEQTSPEKPDK